MTDRADPRADRAKRRRQRSLERAQLRRAFRTGGIVTAARLFIDTSADRSRSRQVVEAEQDCPDCLKLQMKYRDRANRVAGMLA